jgi:hypothetical protein
MKKGNWFLTIFAISLFSSSAQAEWTRWPMATDLVLPKWYEVLGNWQLTAIADAEGTFKAVQQSTVQVYSSLRFSRFIDAATLTLNPNSVAVTLLAPEYEKPSSATLFLTPQQGPFVVSNRENDGILFPQKITQMFDDGYRDFPERSFYWLTCRFESEAKVTLICAQRVELDAVEKQKWLYHLDYTLGLYDGKIARYLRFAKVL